MRASLRMTTLRLALAILFALGSGFAHAQPVSSPVADRAAALGSFEVPKGGDLIAVPVRIAGKQLFFVLDTGAESFVFDESLRDDLGPEIEKHTFVTSAGEKEYTLYKAPAVFFGAADISEAGTVICQDLSELREAYGRDFRGIIGMSSIKTLVFQLDCDDGQLRVLAPGAEGKEGWGVRVPVSFTRRGLPFISMSVAGIERLFLVDTGSGNLCIGRLVAAEMEKTGAASRFRRTIRRTLVGEQTSSSYKLKSLAVGPFQHHGVEAEADQFNILGMSYLRRYMVTFDFGHASLYLKKSKQYDSDEQIDLSGLHLLVKDGRTVVYSVDHDSPAQIAGIQRDDVIISVNAADSSTIGIFATRKMFCSREGAEMRVAVSRPGEAARRTFAFKLTMY